MSEMQIPEYIGYPGKQTSAGYGSEFGKNYDEIVDDRIVIATITPGLPEITGDANIYNFTNGWSEYVKALKEHRIDPPKNSQQYLKIVISQLSPISRSFENEYGDSTILPRGSIVGQGLQDLMWMSGGSTDAIEAELKKKDGGKIRQFLGKAVGGYNSAINGIQNLANDFGDKMGGNGGKMIKGVAALTSELAKSPQSKIGWPKMWRDAHFTQTYQLNTRLYSFSTDNKKEYNNNIRACVGALELLVTPKSDKGALYTAPFIIKFEIPGMIYFPQAYISNLTVTEGGAEGDFAQTGRPNVVDVTMTIQNMYSISVNTTKQGDRDYPYRPSVHKDLRGLSKGKNIGKTSSYWNYANPNSESSGENIDEAKALKTEAENDGYESAQQEAQSGRQTPTDAQKDSDEALKNPQDNQPNDNPSPLPSDSES